MNLKRLTFLALLAVLAAATITVAQEDAEAAMERAKRVYAGGNYRGAIEELGRVLEIEPERADALYLTGYSHLMLREFPESVEWFRRAFQADPTFDPRTIYRKSPAAD
jgi:tetratricopeptide (TPR) repeat protein